MFEAITEESPPVVEAVACWVAESVPEWLPVALEAVALEEDWLGVDDKREVLEVDEGKMMPSTAVLVVSDGCVADVCEVPVPPDELRVDKGKMVPATTVLVVSDGCVPDVCKVPVPPDEPRIDEGAVVDCVAVGGSVDVVAPVDATSEVAGLLESVESDDVPLAPNVG